MKRLKMKKKGYPAGRTRETQNKLLRNCLDSLMSLRTGIDEAILQVVFPVPGESRNQRDEQRSLPGMPRRTESPPNPYRAAISG
jgi:hypothetical protein